MCTILLESLEFHGINEVSWMKGVNFGVTCGIKEVRESVGWQKHVL